MRVAVGLIFDTQGKILIAKRPLHKHMGGLWEFPGGKIELGETSQQALERELWEELNIRVLFSTPGKIFSSNLPYHVILETWEVHSYSGTVHGKESQEIAWIDLEMLADYCFPPTNKQILAYLQEKAGPK